MSQIAIVIKLASGRPSRGYGIDKPRIADGSIIRDVTSARNPSNGLVKTVVAYVTASFGNRLMQPEGIK